MLFTSGGSKGIERDGWPRAGLLKFQWAQRIGPLMEVERNVSLSFAKLRDGLRRLVATIC
jgi:hypothetical protein